MKTIHLVLYLIGLRKSPNRSFLDVQDFLKSPDFLSVGK